MVVLKQCKLQRPVEPLQIPYPSDWSNPKTVDPDDTAIHLSTIPRFLNEYEIELVQAFCKELPYSQNLALTGAKLLDRNDPLLGFDHDQLDRIEKFVNLPNTRRTNGGERQTYERVLIIRERGYEGSGNLKALAGN